MRILVHLDRGMSTRRFQDLALAEARGEAREEG
jgi:hypothetical protein